MVTLIDQQASVTADLTETHYRHVNSPMSKNREEMYSDTNNTVSVSLYIQLFSPSRQPQNIVQLYSKTGEKQTDQAVTTISYIRRNTGLHTTDRPVYLNSLQSPFLAANYFCIKLCRLFSATCLTDRQLNNCIHCAIVLRDFRQNILLKQPPAAKSRE